MPFAIEVFRKLNNDTNPHTTLFMPKSSTPKTLKNTLDVYNETKSTNNILILKKIVFFAIALLLFSAISLSKQPFYSSNLRHRHNTSKK